MYSTYREALNVNSGNGPWLIGHTPASPILIYLFSVCVYVRERTRTSTVWRDLVNSCHMFVSNHEQAEFGKHLAVLPLPDLHLSPSFPATPFRSPLCASGSIHQVSLWLWGSYPATQSLEFGEVRRGWWESDACWALLIKRIPVKIDACSVFRVSKVLHHINTSLNYYFLEQLGH